MMKWERQVIGTTRLLGMTSERQVGAQRRIGALGLERREVVG